MPPVMSHADSRARAEKAWRLKCRGRTWQEIADELGFKSRRSAQRAVETFLKRNPPDDIRVLRMAAGEGLTIIREKLLDGLDRAQKEGRLTAMAELGRAAADTIDKQAKLYGLHIAVPKQVEVNVQGLAEVLADTRSRLLAAIDADDNRDVLDAEVVQELPAGGAAGEELGA